MSYDPLQVYQPEADTYLLLDAARKEVKPGDRVLEVGTGSGFISRELAKVSGIVATDINPHAVLCAGKAGIDVIRTDLFAGSGDPSTSFFSIHPTSRPGRRSGLTTGSSVPLTAGRAGVQ